LGLEHLLLLLSQALIALTSQAKEPQLDRQEGGASKHDDGPGHLLCGR
jgi:hypothetical protein